MTATEFRQRLYHVLSTLAESGERAIITHRGRNFLLIPEAKPPLMERLVRHNTLRVPADELVAAESTPWDWNEERNLDPLP